jgi:hypothetical protein
MRRLNRTEHSRFHWLETRDVADQRLGGEAPFVSPHVTALATARASHLAKPEIFPIRDREQQVAPRDPAHLQDRLTIVG